MSPVGANLSIPTRLLVNFHALIFAQAAFWEGEPPGEPNFFPTCRTADLTTYRKLDSVSPHVGRYFATCSGMKGEAFEIFRLPHK